MANKLIVLCLVLSAFQLTHTLEERDLINDIIENGINAATSIVQPIEKLIQQKISDASGAIRNGILLAEKVSNNVIEQSVNLSGLFARQVQAEVQKALQAGKNVTSCGTLAIQKAQEIVDTSRSTVRTCTNTALDPSRAIEKELLDLLGQAAQLILSIPGQAINCFRQGLFGVFACDTTLLLQVTSQGTLLASTAAADGVKLAGQVIQLPITIGRCEGDGIQYSITQFTALTAKTLACIQNGPSASSSDVTTTTTTAAPSSSSSSSSP